MAYVINRGTKARPLWYAKYRDLDGKWKQKATHQPTMKEAQRFAAELDARIARGQIGIPEVSEQRRKSISVEDLAERFIQEYDRPRLRDRARYIELVRASCRARLYPYPIAKLPAVSVRKLDVIHYRDALRRKGYKPKTVNLTLAWLSRIYNWAAEEEIVECRNPVAHVERVPVESSAVCYSREQVDQLLVRESRHPMVAAALYTGMRKGELFALTWPCVRFDLGTIEVKKSYGGPTKSGKPRTIPLHSDLAPILREWKIACPETEEQLVFPIEARGRLRLARRNDMNDVRAVLEAADCPGDLEHPWHAFRHTFATFFCEAGGALDALSRILGHSSSGNRITAGYVHVSLDYLARELSKLRLLRAPEVPVYRLDDYRQQTA